MSETIKEVEQEDDNLEIEEEIPSVSKGAEKTNLIAKKPSTNSVFGVAYTPKVEVKVKPLPLKKWHGKEGSETFARPKVIEALIDATSGKYATGLTPEEEKKYGQLLGASLSNAVVLGEPHPFFSKKSAQIKLEYNTMIFDISKPLDFVKVKIMRESKFVANSLREWEQGMWPEATHVIFDEQEEATKLSLKSDKLQEVYKILADTDIERKAQVVTVLTGRIIDTKSPNLVSAEIQAIIDKGGEDLESLIRTLKTSKEEVFIRSTIRKAIAKDVLIQQGPAIMYMGSVIGMNMEDAVKWFLDPQHSEAKMKIFDIMDNKK